MTIPVISDDGRVLSAPMPPRTADEVRPGLWLGSFWALYEDRFAAVYDRRRTDDGPTLPDDLDDVVEQVLADLDAGRKVLVCCAMGLNRSALVVAVALQRLNPGWSGSAVLAHLRRVRSPHVLCNPAFERHVRALR